MSSEKLYKILGVVTHALREDDIPYALIGAFALGAYGLPRYTADIDMLADAEHSTSVLKTMQRLGYQCFQNTSVFAQFDSDMGILGRFEFMFVATPDGKEILANCVEFVDQSIGKQPIIQPTDYIILKLMAIANNPDRLKQDEADILALLRLEKMKLIPDSFLGLNRVKINRFAERFRLKSKMDSYFKDLPLSEKVDRL